MSHPFLLQLDGLVRRDALHPGFVARIGVVVRAASGDACWLGVFDQHRASGEMRTHLPQDLDALVLLDEAAAAMLAERGALPSGGVARFAGDKVLMKRFLDRYLQRNNVVGVRVSRGGKDGHSGRTARGRSSRPAAAGDRSRRQKPG